MTGRVKNAKAIARAGCGPRILGSACIPGMAQGPQRGAAIVALAVRSYRAQHRARATEEMGFFAQQVSLQVAIEKAALAQGADGKRLSHQRRIPRAALERMGRRLLAVRKRLQRARSFHELFDLIRREVGGISRIGELTIYDTAHRIGAFLGLEPEQVNLHAGTREGAKALGLNHKVLALERQELPMPFRELGCAEIEDCLCIYKAWF